MTRADLEQRITASLRGTSKQAFSDLAHLSVQSEFPTLIAMVRQHRETQSQKAEVHSVNGHPQAVAYMGAVAGLRAFEEELLKVWETHGEHIKNGSD